MTPQKNQNLRDLKVLGSIPKGYLPLLTIDTSYLLWLKEKDCTRDCVGFTWHSWVLLGTLRWLVGCLLVCCLCFSLRAPSKCRVQGFDLLVCAKQDQLWTNGELGMVSWGNYVQNAPVSRCNNSSRGLAEWNGGQNAFPSKLLPRVHHVNWEVHLGIPHMNFGSYVI